LRATTPVTRRDEGLAELAAVPRGEKNFADQPPRI
jgi:hypothetical protein